MFHHFGTAGRGQVRPASRRKLLNEDELINHVLPYGFKVIDWALFTVSEQIALAHNAKVIIGAHGSNMSNTMYISPGCKVMDMRAGSSDSDLTLSFATQACGGRLFTVIGDAASEPWKEKDFSIHFRDFCDTFDFMMAA